MPKQIKFNLHIDGKPIRDIDELVDNFNIEDLLEKYQNGFLRRWLLARNLINEIAELDNIKGSDVEKARQLCKIFHADCTEEQLEQAAYPFEFRQKIKVELEQLESAKYKRDEVIRSYHDGYDKLLLDMEAHYDDYSFIKTAIMQIYSEYIELFKLDIGNFYWRFILDYPLVILAVIANDKMFPLLKQIKSGEDIYKEIFDSDLIKESIEKRYKEKTPIPFSKWCRTEEELNELQRKFTKVFVLKFCDFPKSIFPAMKDCDPNEIKHPFLYRDIYSYPSHIKVFSGETDSSWKDMEVEGNWMIIHIDEGNFVRNHGIKEEKLGADQINGKFPILKGIQYKSNNSDYIYYMEV